MAGFEVAEDTGGLAESLAVLFEDAVIHDHEKTGAARLLRGFFIYDALLHPNSLRADSDRAFDDFEDEFGAPKDVHDVYLDRNLFERGEGFFVEDFSLIWIDRNDAIARGLKILRHAEAGTETFGRKTDDGDGAGGL